MRRLVVAVIASGWALAGASSAQAAPKVTLSPAVGPPTTSVKVTGTGFQSTTSADVFFDTTDVAIATSNASGGITSTITVPANAQPGNHWITIDERHGALAAQASFVVRTDWPQQGFGAQGRRYNAYENTISPNNVSRLTLAWSAFASQLGNATPFVEYQSNLFVGELNGVVRAYKPTGGLLWTASPGGDLEFVTPAAYNQRVYFGSDNGMVRAYLAVCRADGGVCKPLWSKSVGTAVTGPLTVANRTLYAPSADGTVHALNPTTGAPATPLATLGGSGPVTTGAAFGADGSYVYGRGSTFDWRLPCCSGNSAEGGTVSSAAIAAGAPYFTTSDGLAHQFLSSGWTASIPGAGCNWAPAAANNVIYAASCGTLAALDAGTGAVQWSLSTPAYYNPVVANDVLYTCISTGFNAVVVAFDARYGARLWTGRYCSTQPIVANGVLYVAGNGQLDAYDLQSAVAARGVRRAGHRPDPRKLRIDPRLHRHHKR